MKLLWRKISACSSYYYARGINLAAVRGSNRFLLKTLYLCFLSLLLPVEELKADTTASLRQGLEKEYQFSIPRQQADLSLTQIAEQANVTLIFPFDYVQSKTTNEVNGLYNVKEALTILLRNTGLSMREKRGGRLSVVLTKPKESIMRKLSKLSSALFAAAVTAYPASNLLAQDSSEAGEMEELIVTGTAQPVVKLDSTASVTAIQSEDIRAFAPRSVADIFTNIPGIQAESVAGEANTNIKVRGLPISAGGSRYLSLQEDGLPIFLIGDYDFATAESYLRFDDSVGSVQSIRGGSGATAAPNSPGGIINFISKTGEEEAGTVALTSGLNYSANRLDFAYGKPLDNDWRFHVGGYARKGEGPREAVDDIESGFNLKANVTKEFDAGHVRFNFRRNDETVPTYLPLTGVYQGGGEYSEVGVDFGQSTFYRDGSASANRLINGQPSSETTDLSTGFEVDYTSFGVETQVDVSDSTTIDFKARNASIAGQFVSPFPIGISRNANGTPSATFIYFDTKLSSLDNSVFDLSVNQDFGAVSAKAGVFKGTQDYNASWYWDIYNIELDGNQTPSTDPAAPFFVPGSFARAFDFEIENTAPYLALNGQFGDSFSWDAGVRKDSWDVNGYQVNNATDAAGNAITDAAGGFTLARGNNEIPVNYDFSETSFSMGGNYSLTDSSALFFNYAEGGSLSAPSRTTGNINPDGTIPNSSVVFNAVTSTELGYKYKGDSVDFFATFFDTETAEASNFQLTTNTFIENSFASSGIELEWDAMLNDNWGVNGTLMHIDSEITASNSAANVGNEPRKQPDTFLTVTPKYQSDRLGTGLNLQYFSEAFAGDDNTATLGAYMVANYFLNYSINDKTTVSMNINNLLDEVGFTDNQDASANVGDYSRVTANVGRTASLSLRYDF